MANDNYFTNDLADEFEGLLETYIEELEPTEIIDGLSLVVARMAKSFPAYDLIDRAISNLEELDTMR